LKSYIVPTYEQAINFFINLKQYFAKLIKLPYVSDNKKISISVFPSTFNHEIRKCFVDCEQTWKESNFAQKYPDKKSLCLMKWVIPDIHQENGKLTERIKSIPWYGTNLSNAKLKIKGEINSIFVINNNI